MQQAAAGLNISVPAANAALNKLRAAGIVSLVDERQCESLAVSIGQRRIRQQPRHPDNQRKERRLLSGLKAEVSTPNI